MLADSLGNPVTLRDAASLARVDDFVQGFIASEARAVRLLEIAGQDHSAIVQAYAAALQMFAETRDAPAAARPFIDRALAVAPSATAREQRFIAAVKAWVDGDIALANRLHAEQADDFPRDLVSLKLGQYHLFNHGNAPAMLRLALSALPAAADVPYLHGMLAFGWEQCHFMREAEAAARHAITLCRKEPWVHHALAHVMLTEGRLREGLAFMREFSDSWTDLNSFMVTHNWWHVALFALDLGEDDEVLRLYDQQVWGVSKDYSQDQINAVSLLARLETAGVDVGNRWQDLADHLAPRVQDHLLPFLDLQYLYGLARAGRVEAATLLANMEHHARHARPDEAAAWHHVGIPAGRGLLAHACGDFVTAARDLGIAMPRLLEIGGSHAQRDLFAQLHLDALLKSGGFIEAQNILQPLLNRQPESRRLERLARQANSSLGLPC
jgi:hypothetical protein